MVDAHARSTTLGAPDQRDTDGGPEALAAAAAGGDMNALGQLYEQYADLVLRTAILGLPGNRHGAEDVAQETWVRVARNIGGYTTIRGGFPAWVTTITKRLIYDQHRGATRRRETLTGDLLALDLPCHGDTPEMAAMRNELSTMFADAVGSLKREHAEVLVFRFFQGLSTVETAAMLGKTDGATRVLQHRALRALLKKLPEALREPRTTAVLTATAPAAVAH